MVGTVLESQLMKLDRVFCRALRCPIKTTKPGGLHLHSVTSCGAWDSREHQSERLTCGAGLEWGTVGHSLQTGPGQFHGKKRPYAR